MSRGSRFARVLRQQATLRGKREIERPPEQPERSAADMTWLRANIRKEQQHDEQQGQSQSKVSLPSSTPAQHHRDHRVVRGA